MSKSKASTKIEELADRIGGSMGREVRRLKRLKPSADALRLAALAAEHSRTGISHSVAFDVRENLAHVADYRKNLAPKVGGADLFEILVSVPDDLSGHRGIGGSTTSIHLVSVSGPRGTLERVCRGLSDFLTELAGSSDGDHVSINLRAGARGETPIVDNPDVPDVFELSLEPVDGGGGHSYKALLHNDGSREDALNAIGQLADAFNRRYAATLPTLTNDHRKA